MTRPVVRQVGSEGRDIPCYHKSNEPNCVWKLAIQTSHLPVPRTGWNLKNLGTKTNNTLKPHKEKLEKEIYERERERERGVGFSSVP